MLHFTDTEFANRSTALHAAIEARGLDGMLLFAPESQFWLTGYDTFGYCFFQCLVVGGKAPALLTRSADLRQAELTSNLSDIRIWKDAANANPAQDLAAMLRDLGLSGKRLGIELDTHGLTAHNWERVRAALDGVVELVDASDLISPLRLVKSDEELVYVRRAAQLADDALEAAYPLVKPGAEEGDILAAMQGAVFSGGGDYAGNEFIIGAGEHALLCRYASGRQTLAEHDQLTLEWAGAYRHYHAAAMRTLVVGEPDPTHEAMFQAAQTALHACEAALKPGALMGDVFAEHARVFEELGLGAHRLNACGYALGTRFSPSWMEREMFFEGAEVEMAPGMVFFLHMILMNSEAQTAMCLGRTSLVVPGGSELLTKAEVQMMA